MWPAILLKKLSNDKKLVYIGGGNIFAYNPELLRYSNHFPHVIYKKQCKLEEKVNNNKEIKIAHKVHHAGKKNDIFNGSDKSKFTNKDSKDYLASEKRT